MKVAFVGLGKLGLECAEVMANLHDVCGFDVAPRKSSIVKVMNSVEEAIKDRDLIFVAVQTPHENGYDGRTPTSHLPTKDFDYSYVESALDEINKYATKNQLVVLISTCLPGTTRKRFVQRIPNARFIYNPYLIAMGSTEFDMVNPEMVMIGTEDGSYTTDANILIEFYRTLMKNDPRYIVGTWDEIECLKIFYNTWISAKIGLTNLIMDVAMKNGNINVDVVTKALGESTMRIMSPKYMIAGLGDAGPCHTRDNIALRNLAKELDLGYDLFAAIMDSREVQARNIAKFLNQKQKETSLPIYVFGKTYKPNVPYLDGSYSLLIGHFLEEMGANFAYVDPNTGDLPPAVPCIAFLAHNQRVTYGYANVVDKQPLYIPIRSGSIVVDPWREYETDDLSVNVIHYGNTRFKKN